MGRARTAASGTKGFTLIEVMIASGLMALEILAVLAMFNTATKTLGYSRKLTTSTSLGQTQLETAKNTAYANVPLLAGTQCFSSALGTVLCAGTVPYVYTRVTTVAADTPTSGMSQVTVRVTWRDSQGATRGTTLISGVSKF
jgi:Tfp pilus assembly protein PilV